MFGNFLNKFENPELPLLGPNVYFLRFWGLLLPKNICKRYLYIFFHSLVTCVAISGWIDLWYIKSNISMIMNNMKVTLIATITVFKVASYLHWQDSWISIIDYVTKADLIQRNTSDIKKKNIIQNYTKYCRATTYLYCGLAYGMAFSLIPYPALKYYLSATYRGNVRNGTEAYVEIVPTWVPFDKTAVPGYLGALAFEAFYAIYGGGWLTSFDTFCMVTMVFMKGELQMLRIDSTKIYGTEKHPVPDDEAKKRLKDCYTRHVQLVKYVNLFDSCLSPIMLLYMFACSAILCVTAYQITIETSLVQTIFACEYLVLALAHLFIYCWHSHEVLYASQQLMSGPYESMWYMRNVKKNKDLYILVDQFNKDVVFNAGPFAKLTLATFVNVLKGAYSYYTLLSKSDKK